MREGHKKLFQINILSFFTSKVEQGFIFNSLNEYTKFDKRNSYEH